MNVRLTNRNRCSSSTSITFCYKLIFFLINAVFLSVYLINAQLNLNNSKSFVIIHNQQQFILET